MNPEERYAQRVARLPKITYPDLPIVAKKEAIIQALQQNKVIIVAGETGSGKTTQLPKICLEAGFGIKGLIGHTQPRRIAAKSMAIRIAEELQTPLGEAVGYQIRFSDKSSPDTYIKVMTDGILLSQTGRDRSLRQYDCLIIDEAHERSLNIDFLLGYLKTLLQKRHDLKVIITSATIDVERFSNFFNQAPLINVEGRSYPVEVNYLTPEKLSQDSTDDPAVPVELAVQQAYARGPGDILIFQSGEKEIREAAEVLGKLKLPNTKILPLYARQNIQDQQLVFKPASHRKIIISTNVAETSITVPNIRFVIDSGLVRMSRYNYRSKLQRLPIEPISQASAEQRKGRCGRVGPGICYRLYSEEDYLSRPLFTEPEILRTNLAGVILKMIALKLTDIERFPFLDPPDSRYIKDGMMLLERLGAIDSNQIITEIGRHLSNIPIEPKLGRMLIAANQYGALAEVLIIVSALSIVDPRDRPAEFREKADAAHSKFTSESSDFLTFLNLWEFVFEKRKTLTHSQFRYLCRDNFLSFMRISEWFDIHSQLKEMVKELGFKFNQVPSHESLIHKSILTGLLDSIGLKQDKKEYLGARGIKFYLHPSSALFKKSPNWMMACEIVHTTKIYARTIAIIEPGWIEEVAGPLLKRQYYEAHFEKKSGRVVAFEKITLFGLEIANQRKINYERINSKESRGIFIRQGLVENNAQIRAPFFHKNLKTIQELEALSDRIRKQYYFVDEHFLFEFYDKRIPEDIVSVPALEKWLKGQNDDFLTFSKEEISALPDVDQIEEQYPTDIEIKGDHYQCEYLFDPKNPEDGMTLLVPIESISKLKDEDLTNLLPHGWQNNKKGFHHKMHFKVVDKKKEVLAKGDSLPGLFSNLKEQYSQDIVGSHPLEKKNIVQWDFGELPQQVDIKKGTHFTYYPALVDYQTDVSIELFISQSEANQKYRYGLARLFVLQLKEPIRQLKKNLATPQKKLFEKWQPADKVLDAIYIATSIELLGEDPHFIRTPSAFEKILLNQRPLFLGLANQLILVVSKIIETRVKVLSQLSKSPLDAYLISVHKDIKQQMERLFPEDFISKVPIFWLKRVVIYLEAILQRLEKVPRQIVKDKQWMQEVQSVQKAINQIPNPFDRDLFHWKVEELRVSLFAQSLGTLEPVSKVRLLKQIADLAR